MICHLIRKADPADNFSLNRQLLGVCHLDTALLAELTRGSLGRPFDYMSASALLQYFIRSFLDRNLCVRTALVALCSPKLLSLYGGIVVSPLNLLL